ncbi:mannan O-acetyltransferase 1, TRICHOME BIREFRINGENCE-LIKE 23 [Hibiscus trionum]|uniref:Mannan O-acetyltransferase 1, TRICHOME BIREFRINGENCE-LIKE 23 n=1 Tax=Hibiscus trionum TaxID=183268 RepID=A0A9W7IZT5_HIBTR|nr:mannan O-acetyltransferase 1, TRICHOME BIREFRINGENCE-LIKE 23 [Hibiscus trionum]
MRLNWNSWSLNKDHHLLVKLAISILLLGFAFRLLFFSSDGFAADFQSLMFEKQLVQEPDLKPPVPLVMPENEDQLPLDIILEKCDLFTGDWIPNPSGPTYTNESCPLIEGHQNCMRNGRPDSGYLHWKWKPRDCQLPRFDAKRFLELMRNKAWALIGDSISRNHVQSLLCMLSTVEQAVEVYHDEDYKSKRWHFKSYNFTVSNIWSPFLVKAAIFEDNNGVSTAEVQLHLDKLDKTWTDLYPSLDYMIISTGKWFLKAAIYHENDTEVGCHICPGKNLTELGFVYAYNKTLHYVMDFIANSKHKGLIFFRTSTPDHFENGEWHNGGTCPKTTPTKEGEIEIKDLNRILRNVELEEFEKAAAKAAKNEVNLKLLDFTNFLLMRPDGHPGPYRQFQPFAENKTAAVQNDCLHWCLPGPIDFWNDVIMEMVVRG